MRIDIGTSSLYPAIVCVRNPLDRRTTARPVRDRDYSKSRLCGPDA